MATILTRRLRRASWLALLLALLGALSACGGASSSSGGAQEISGAWLGGTKAAFDARYGTAQTANNLLYVYSVTGSAPERIGLALAKGADGQGHVSAIGVTPPTAAPWDAATAQARYAPLLPTDATHVKDQQVSHDGTPVTVGIYHSAALAATFPAAAFIDQQHQPVDPGTFFVQCIPAQGGAGTGACILMLGETYQ